MSVLIANHHRFHISPFSQGVTHKNQPGSDPFLSKWLTAAQPRHPATLETDLGKWAGFVTMSDKMSTPWRRCREAQENSPVWSFRESMDRIWIWIVCVCGLHTVSCVIIYIHIHIYIYTYIPIYICTYVHIYIYTYIYIHIYIYTYVHIYIYTYIHIYICTYIHIYIYIHIHIFIYIYTYIHIYIYTYIHIYIYTYVHIYIYTYIHIYIYTYIHIYIYTYIHIYIYTYIHVCVCFVFMYIYIYMWIIWYGFYIIRCRTSHLFVLLTPLRNHDGARPSQILSTWHPRDILSWARSLLKTVILKLELSGEIESSGCRNISSRHLVHGKRK